MRYSAISEVNADQQRFFESAVKSLIRRLRRSQERGIVDNLVRSIKNRDPDTACVRIMRSLDGRMQSMLLHLCFRSNNFWF